MPPALHPISRYRLLDPRPAVDSAARPLLDAVNIPVADLAERVAELPPRDTVVEVAEIAPHCAPAVEWLRAAGRAAVAVPEFRYAASEAPPRLGRLWEPNEFLRETLPLLHAGVAHASDESTALDLACGSGRDAVYLASAGWQVTAIDRLPDALALGQRLAARYAADLQPLRWIVADLECPSGPRTIGAGDTPASAASDHEAWLDCPDQFELICVFRYLHRPLLATLRRWLAPGGHLLHETFTTRHRERHGKPARDAHVLQPGELRGLCEGGAHSDASGTPPLQVRQYDEAWRADGSHTARLWATRGDSV